MIASRPALRNDRVQRENERQRAGKEGDRADLVEFLGAIDFERERIALNLHRSICQSVQGAALMCRVLERKLRSEAPNLVPDVSDLSAGLLRASEELHQLMLEIDDGGGGADLVSALASLSERVSETVPCTFRCEDPVKIADPFVARQVWQIAREIIGEALGCEAVSALAISLVRNEDDVLLAISHDGAQADMKSREQENPFAKLIHMRARAIGASISSTAPVRKEVTTTCKFRNKP